MAAGCLDKCGAVRWVAHVAVGLSVPVWPGSSPWGLPPFSSLSCCLSQLGPCASFWPAVFSVSGPWRLAYFESLLVSTQTTGGRHLIRDLAVQEMQVVDFKVMCWAKAEEGEKTDGKRKKSGGTKVGRYGVRRIVLSTLSSCLWLYPEFCHQTLS